MYKFNRVQKIIAVVLAFYLAILAIYITVNFSLNKLNGGELGKTKVVSNENAEDSGITTKDTVIILNMKFESNKDTIKKEIKAGNDYKDITKSEIQAKFTNLGFKLDNFSTEKVEFSKTSFYLPKKYVIGIKDGKICIYKTDEYGNLKIETKDDVFNDMEASKLPDKERQFLYKGHVNYQFTTKEEAISAVDDYREFFKQN